MLGMPSDIRACQITCSDGDDPAQSKGCQEVVSKVSGQQHRLDGVIHTCMVMRGGGSAKTDVEGWSCTANMHHAHSCHWQAKLN